MTLRKICLLYQQLMKPVFHPPKEFVSWMGTMQAQIYSMAKWAIILNRIPITMNLYWKQPEDNMKLFYLSPKN